MLINLFVKQFRRKILTALPNMPTIYTTFLKKRIIYFSFYPSYFTSLVNLQVFLGGGGKHPPDVTEALVAFTEVTSVPTV